LCHLYEGDPEQAVAKLEGMFGFGIWRSRERELILARDPFGKKPLYYAIGQGLLAFASELRCLEQVPGLCTDIDDAGMQFYLLLQYIHAPRTIYRGVHKLEPGCQVRFRVKRERLSISPVQRYFSFQPKEPWRWQAAREEEAIETLRGHVVAAVRDRLMGDVPLGAFLSGGIDSSLVVATMVKDLGVRPKTFSIGFKDTPDSEHLAARRIADWLGTDHHELLVDPSAVEMVPTIAAALDEPNGDSSCLPVYLLSEFTRRHVTVALSGDGGDEMFGGYGRYGQTLQEAKSPWRYWYSLRHLRQWWTPSRAYLDRRALTMPPHTVLPLVGTFHPDVLAQMDRWRHHLNARWQPLIHRMRQFDAEAYMPGAVLAKVDRMSMQFALEVRCPLLDVRLGRWAAGLPARYCHDGETSKRILKKLAAHYLPDDIINRPKMGFGLPDRTWAKGPLLNLACDLLLSPQAKVGDRLQRSGLQAYLTRQQDPHCFSIYQVWNLVILEQWLRGAARAAAPALAA
jgi:asparagine synthase (glutamine-hydrolysing)